MMNGVIEDELADDKEAKVPKESKYNSISYQKIPYPLTDKLHMLHRAYETGEKCFPTVLDSPFNPEQSVYITTVLMMKILLLQSG